MITALRNLSNYGEFIEGTRRVRDKLLKEADGSALTFCLGGECTFIVGSVAKERQKGTA